MGQERNTTANYDGLFIAKLSKKPLVMTCSFFRCFSLWLYQITLVVKFSYLFFVKKKLLWFYFEKLIINKTIDCIQKNYFILIDFFRRFQKMTFDCKGGLIQNYVFDFCLIITGVSLNFW